jgi:hypothetical protein
MTRKAPTVLVLYHANQSPLRTTIADHLFALAKYRAGETIFLNVAVRSVPPWTEQLGIDVVVFHTTLLAQRWNPRAFLKVRRRLDRLRGGSWTKFAIPQDEFINTDALCDFLRDFHVDHVLTCAAPSQWPVIYGDLARGPMSFTQVLTGYLDPRTVARIDRLASETEHQAVDIAYRAWRPEYWLGRHAQLKSSIAEAFETEAPNHGLTTDISLRERDTLLGDAWYRLLLGARWTIGVEGGASVIDRDGSLRRRTLEYVRTHPSASFEEVEAACFPGQEGNLDLMTLSPRHLEACATRTAQVLVEGEYNGILNAGVHYLPLKQDLSNVAEVCEAMRDDELRESLANRAFRDIVESHRFDYEALARLVVPETTRRSSHRSEVGQSLLFAWESRQDRISWFWVALRQRVKGIVRDSLDAIGLLPYVQRVRGVRVATRG